MGVRHVVEFCEVGGLRVRHWQVFYQIPLDFSFIIFLNKIPEEKTLQNPNLLFYYFNITCFGESFFAMIYKQRKEKKIDKIMDIFSLIIDMVKNYTSRLSNYPLIKSLNFRVLIIMRLIWLQIKNLLKPTIRFLFLIIHF